MKVSFVDCSISIFKALYAKCLCISIKTKSSSNVIKNEYNNEPLSFRNNCKLGTIYEDIEYNSITDLALYKFKNI